MVAIKFYHIAGAMENPFLKSIRNSRMNLKDVYFWTNTIKDWKHLLKEDKFKLTILEELKWLVDNKKIAVYAYHNAQSYAFGLGTT
ncbi:hypothetical protein [Sporocytophaga myxococcoides]|uniref:hypothetical protein n=1 Tax=Sporocytophaga myxococcoides TaxID=153721 RepID=UPI001B7F9CBD|nr:hypothetical protein [Sporocytophaga myxococcoides]